MRRYKWLLCPRGTAFFTIRPERRDELVPHAAGWYAGEDPASSYSGAPLRLAADARRFDLSPAWLNWVGAAPALELLEEVGVGTIHAHDLRMANRLRAGLGCRRATRRSCRWRAWPTPRSGWRPRA